MGIGAATGMLAFGSMIALRRGRSELVQSIDDWAAPQRQFDLKHGYNVGQSVELKPNVMRMAAAGPYEITRLMPEPDVNSESPRYRTKSREEIHQRIVPESDLMLPTGPTSGAPVTRRARRFWQRPVCSCSADRGVN